MKIRIVKPNLEYIYKNTFFFSCCDTLEEMKVLTDMMVLGDNIKPYYKFKYQAEMVYPGCDLKKLYLEHHLAHSFGILKNQWFDNSNNDRYMIRISTCFDSRSTYLDSILDGVTLPYNDPFWDKFFPPNRFGDLSTTLMVRSSKCKSTNSEYINQLAHDNIHECFHFNPGKDMFPIERFISHKDFINDLYNVTL